MCDPSSAVLVQQATITFRAIVASLTARAPIRPSARRSQAPGQINSPTNGLLDIDTGE